MEFERWVTGGAGATAEGEGRGVRTGWLGGAGHRMVPFRGSRAPLLDWNPGWSPRIGCRTGPEAPQIKSSSEVRSNPVDVKVLRKPSGALTYAVDHPPLKSHGDHRLHNPTARARLPHIKRMR